MGTRWWARNQISAVCWKRIICTWIWSVGTVIANAAYGDGRTRQQFAAAGRTLIGKVPKRPARTHFAKEDFQIDLAAGTCTCPAGQMTRSVRRRGSYVTATAERVRPGARFTLTRRSVRPVRSAPAVWPPGPGHGRQVSLHPQETFLQAARTLQQSGLSHPIATSAKPWSTAWPGWCNWVYGKPGISGVARPPPSSIPPLPSLT